MKAVSVIPSAEGTEFKDQTTETERAFLRDVWDDRVKTPLRGKVLGRLFVIEELKNRGKDGLIRLLVECRCGKRFDIRADSVYSGRTTSCGCFRKEVSRLSLTERMRDWTGKSDQLMAARSRFLAKVKEGNFSAVCSSEFGRCLEWRAAKTEGGYGILSVGVHPVRATHLAWFYTYGEMPTLPVRHICDNPSCVNPDHLYEADQASDGYDRKMKNSGGVLIEVFRGPYLKDKVSRELREESVVTKLPDGGHSENVA